MQAWVGASQSDCGAARSLSLSQPPRRGSRSSLRSHRPWDASSSMTSSLGFFAHEYICSEQWVPSLWSGRAVNQQDGPGVDVPDARGAVGLAGKGDHGDNGLAERGNGDDDRAAE